MKVSKPSIKEPPKLELKHFPLHLKYAYLGDNKTLPVVITAGLSIDQEAQLLEVLRRSKKALGWKIAVTKGITLAFCMHKILLEDCKSNSIEK